MSNIIRLVRDPWEAVSEDTKVDELFDDIIERNKQVKEKLARERLIKNRQVLNNYHIRRRT